MKINTFDNNLRFAKMSSIEISDIERVKAAREVVIECARAYFDALNRAANYRDIAENETDRAIALADVKRTCDELLIAERDLAALLPLS